MRWIDAIGGLGWMLLVIGVLVCFSTAGDRSELFAWTVGGTIWLAGFVMIASHRQQRGYGVDLLGDAQKFEPVRRY